MELLRRITKIDLIVNNLLIRSINTIQKFDEDECRLKLRCAENINEFKRGLVCDLESTFAKCDECGTKLNDSRIEMAKDLVLVYINKYVDFDSIPQFEYVFYK